jgi:hypothetical protein
LEENSIPFLIGKGQRGFCTTQQIWTNIRLTGQRMMMMISQRLSHFDKTKGGDHFDNLDNKFLNKY